MIDLEWTLENLRGDFLSHPTVIHALAARYLIGEYDRDLLPDWVAALANGDINYWDDLVSVVQAEMEAENV